MKGGKEFLLDFMKKLFYAVMCAGLALMLVACSAPESEITPDSSTVPNETSVPEESELSEDKGAFWEMDTVDVFGDEVTGSIFAENDITLVNFWATWCPPCIAEMPHLAELADEVADKNVGIIGIAVDVMETGSVNGDVLEEALAIMESSGVEFPVLLTDQVLYDEVIANLFAYPTTIFVDSNGNVVGSKYERAYEKDDWAEIIDTELTNLLEGAG